MGQGEHHTEYPAQANIFVVVTVALLLAVIYVFGDSIEDAAQSVFDLTRMDLTIIPVAGFAFFLFWRLLNKVLFAPVLDLVEERERLTAGAEVTAASAKEETAALEAEYEEKLTAARIEGMQLKSKVLAQARSEAQMQIEEASITAAVDMEQARARIEAEADELRAELLAESEELVSSVIDKVTGTPETAKNSLS